MLHALLFEYIFVTGSACTRVWCSGNLFFQDFSQFAPRERLAGFDRKFQLLLSFPQVLCTPHSAFCTHEALRNIAETTVENLQQFAAGRVLTNLVKPQ